MSETSIVITPELSIPLVEISYRASRSGGPGGQHVNTSSTRIELIWNVDGSTAITEEQRDLIRAALPNRISREGLFQLTSEATRSQHRNREIVTERFAKLLGDALRPVKPRKKSKTPLVARRKRLEAKKRRSETKRLRRPPESD